MSATIDHLEAHHRVTVIRAFMDARGISVPAGASGVIQLMGLDTKAMEFTIDRERDGKSERLTFSLMAKDGPRNGAMRDYFEMGEFVAPPRSNKEARPETPFRSLPSR